MKRIFALSFSILLISGLLCGCKGEESEETTSAETTASSITLLNSKTEVSSQIEDLAAAYTAETGTEVSVITVPAGVDASATIKGYYLSDQMLLSKNLARL